jgi:hypothetical protein
LEDPKAARQQSKTGYTEPTPELKLEFLTNLRETGMVDEASRLMDITEGSVYRWRSKDSIFAEKWDEIIHNYVLPKLEQTAVRRAIDGSDLMLIFLMKAYDRDRYDDKIVMANRGHVKPPKATRVIIEDAGGRVIAEVEEDEDGDPKVRKRTKVNNTGGVGN